MKRLGRNLPIYALSGALLVSSIIYSNEASSAPQYVTLQKYNKDLKAIVTEIAKLQITVRSLQSCVNDLTVQLGGNGRNVVC
jgi:hypothetical protein